MSIHGNHMVDGLDASLADLDEADAHAEFVDRFAQDAADELLQEEGNSEWFIGREESLSALFRQVLWVVSPEDAFTAIHALRDALRDYSYKEFSGDVQLRAERLAAEQIASDEGEIDEDSPGARALRRFGFPSILG
jgi:hypothetical protein